MAIAKTRSIASWSYSNAEGQSQKPQVKELDELEQVNNKVVLCLFRLTAKCKKPQGLGEGLDNAATDRVDSTRSAAFS